MLGGRFEWILDIAKPDAILTVLVALIGVAGMLVQPSPSAENRNLMMLLSTAVTTPSYPRRWPPESHSIGGCRVPSASRRA